MIIAPEEGVKLLREGKVIGVPTETVYGLAADALNPEAIAKVFEVKNRPADNPLICHFSSAEQVRHYVKEIPVVTEKLMEKFSPGPISFMLDLNTDSPLKFATCGSEQVIVRIPDHPILLDIIRQFDRPLAAPSANTSGKVSPTSAQMVETDLGNKIDGIVDGAECKVGIESTIIDARRKNEIIILRHGVIGEKELQLTFPDLKIRAVKDSEHGVTPGTKYRHYAPDTQVFTAESFVSVFHERNIALLLTEEQFESISPDALKKFSNHHNQFVPLGSMKNLNDLARNFYSKFALLDTMQISKAFILKNDWGSSSLGKALQTRLQKITSH